MADWKIARRRGLCSACERPFEDGERHVCTLAVGEEGLERGEYCAQWWAGHTAGCPSQECAQACQERAEGGGAAPPSTCSGGSPATRTARSAGCSSIWSPSSVCS